MANLEQSRAQRLDQKVIELVPSISRAFASKLIEQGKVQVNGQPIFKAGYKLRADDTVTVDYDEKEQEQIPDIEIPILYEDDDCVVIDKPVGLLTHSKGAFNPEATVATWLRKRLPDHKSANRKDVPPEMGKDGVINSRAGIVHRLDRATSGVMICAKTPEALSKLQKQFSQRKAKKSYIAIVDGVLAEPKAVIDMPIERNPRKPQTFRVGANGKSAITEYEVLEENPEVSEVLLKPQTGRTHQLRVHLSQLGNPIIGDVLYGGKEADRLYLHALSLEITLPNSKREVFTSPLPEEFKTYMETA